MKRCLFPPLGLALAGMALLAGCSAPAPDLADAAAPRFDPLAFFAGPSRGEGGLRILWKAPRPVHVASQGRLGPDKALVLDQRIAEGDKPPRVRRWRIRAIAPDRWAGTLTDARGPVRIEAAGNRLHIAFEGRDGLAYEQWLALSRDGASAHNILVARRFGFVLGVLDETIRKLPQGQREAAAEPPPGSRVEG